MDPKANENLPSITRYYYISFVHFYCEFNYLDQFYSFTRVIHSHRLLPQCLSITRSIF